jgi:hypothetical protein
LFISSSLASAAASTIFSRHSLQVSTSSAGISPYENLVPCDASSQTIAFILIRSTTPSNFSSAPIGTCNRNRIGLQAQPHLVMHLEEVRALAVHLVHKGKTRHAVLVGLAPHGFRLRLHTAHGAIHHAGAVKHAHRALDFDGEVDVTRGVDDVDAVLGKFPAMPFQKQVVAAEVMVMPRSCSCSIQSMVAAPS